ncbi:type IV pilin-like G/H family protein [Kovacikia minuta CCNUW1]|uniref:type IV pilin-like G/H family protein n=1 Tax=Kovacikia minuta TaxID=2931930 RepID=UPI001CCAED97|nr:type IV pilin-like G/H family protein [Kovacikia minuta]UBF25233.1 type IV pilin-like G/H family protein [Kovacikia minuta CCNUW1]
MEEISSVGANDTRRRFLKHQAYVGFITGLIVGVVGFSLVPYLFPARNKEYEGKIVRSLNTAQQSYYWKNKKFSNSFKELGVTPQSEAYTYLTISTDKAAFQYAVSRPNNYQRSYVGGVFVLSKPIKASDGIVETETIVCQSLSRGYIQEIVHPIDSNTCGVGTERIDF